MPKVNVRRNVKLSPEQFVHQIENIPLMLDAKVLDFEQSVAERALNVFKKSFKYQRFYTASGKKWQELSETTIRKRKRKGTWHNRSQNILNEYGTLKGSISIDYMGGDEKMKDAHKLKRRVFTDPKKFNVATNPHRGFCYAGVHNNPYGDTYGTRFGARPAIQRQFMGYSTYIDKYSDYVMDKKLFDGLFGNVDSNDVGFIDNVEE